MTVRHRFQVEAIDLGDTTFAALLTVTEKRSRESACRLLRGDFGANRRRQVTTRANVSRSYLNPAFIRDQERVDDIYASTDVAQKAREKSTRHRCGIHFNNLAGKPEVASVERELRAALIEKMILDFDYLPLPAQLAN